MKRVLFCIAPQELSFSYNSAPFWSVGTLRVASMLKNPQQNRLFHSLGIKKTEEFDVRLVDGDIEGLEKTLQFINSDVDVLAIHNPSSYAYRNALVLARKGKECGIKNVAIGGHHTNFLYESALRNNPELDVVFTGRGEIGFLKYCLGYPLEEIENIAFRYNRDIKTTWVNDPVSEGFKDFMNSMSSHPLHPDNLPPIDYSLIDSEKYNLNFERFHSFVYTQNLTKAMVEFTHEGCLWRENSKGCNFCSLPTKGMIYRNPEKFWDILKRDAQFLRAQVVKDYGDCLTGNEDYLKALAETKPKELEDLAFECYARSNEVIRGDTISHLKKLGAIGVHVGIESGSDKVLTCMHKGYGKETSRKSLELLAHNGIRTFCSLVLGSRGESLESLEETYNFFRQISESYEIASAGANPISIFPGSFDWQELTTNHKEILVKYGVNLETIDSANMNSLKLAYLEVFCSELVQQCGNSERAYETLIDYSKKIQNLGRIKNRLGWECGKCASIFQNLTKT